MPHSFCLTRKDSHFPGRCCKTYASRMKNTLLATVAIAAALALGALPAMELWHNIAAFTLQQTPGGDVRRGGETMRPNQRNDAGNRETKSKRGAAPDEQGDDGASAKTAGSCGDGACTPSELCTRQRAQGDIGKCTICMVDCIPGAR